jgi:hypothetical protein
MFLRVLYPLLFSTRRIRWGRCSFSTDYCRSFVEALSLNFSGRKLASYCVRVERTARLLLSYSGDVAATTKQLQK